MKDEGAKFLASFGTLSVLFVDNNGLGTKGISSLANLNLRVLNICEITLT